MIEPVLILDSRERFWPVGVEESLKAAGAHNYLWSASEKSWYFGSDEFPKGHLEFPADMKQPDLPPVGYLERMSGECVDWLRFHIWFLDNPGPQVFRGLGRHRGDWEMLQIGVQDSSVRVDLGATPTTEGWAARLEDDDPWSDPLVVTCSQHDQGQSRKAWHPNCDIGIRDDGTQYIRIYVALGSHALYFTKGEHGIGDVCDGKGRHLTPEWRKAEDQPWWDWPGRWGGDRSPRSPGCQRKDPDIYDLRAKQ